MLKEYWSKRISFGKINNLLKSRASKKYIEYLILMSNISKKGFTLVELLIVIAIVATLATATIVVLNPAELLAQARDAQRIADLSNIRTALGLFVISVPAPNVCANASAGCAAGGTCMVDPALGNGPFSTQTCGSISIVRTVAGAGWVDVNLTTIPGGSPLAVLAVDPTNTAAYFYAYKADNAAKTFKLAGRLESLRHRGMMTTDGGTRNTCATHVENTCFYEIGTNLAL